ncbi:MAG: energy transducer TonB [Chthoniobacterales bacterium]
MRHLFLAWLLISCVLFASPLAARADRAQVGLIDNEPVYHWTSFSSFIQNDIDRALILRAFRQRGLGVPKHIVDDHLQKKIDQDYGGDRSKLLADLKENGESMNSYRQFFTEEISLQAMLMKETKLPQHGHSPPTEAEWLAALRKGTKIRTTTAKPEDRIDTNDAVQVSEAQADLLAKPLPEYPYIARRDFLQGQGLYLVRFDLKTGLAIQSSVVRTCGHPILDQSALQALRQWRIKPQTFAKIKVPFNFKMNGDEAALMRAIGHNLLYAVPPHYPLAAGAHGVAGKGRFQLVIDPSTGLVTDVQTLQTTHDQRLDAAAVKAFRQWRFRPHTLQKLVAPVDFNIRYG